MSPFLGSEMFFLPIFKASNQKDAQMGVPALGVKNLGGFPTRFHVKILNHPIETI